MAKKEIQQIADKSVEALMNILEGEDSNREILKLTVSFFNDLAQELKKVHKEDLFYDLVKEIDDKMKKDDVTGEIIYVTSQVELTDAQKNKLEIILKSISGFAKVVYSIDNDLVGGLKINYKDNEIDLTTSGKLKKMISKIS